MTEVVFDIEADSLTPTQVWCVGNYTMGQKFRLAERPGEFTFDKEKTYYAHNGIGYDYPVLNRLWGTPTRCSNQLDTLVLSRLANPSRNGGHSLESWGVVLGYPKGDFSDYSRYTPQMAQYCERDVQLTARVLGTLRGELTGFSQQSIDLEHKAAWLIQEQMDNGWLLDQGACFELLGELKEKKNELEDAVRETFKPIAKAVKEITPKTNKDGSTSVVGLKYLGDSCLDLVGGPHTRIDWQEFNLGSRKQIGERLVALGWRPPKLTPKGQPQVDETTLKNVDFPEGTLIADYLTVEKRIAMAQSWLDFVQPDGRVHGKVNSNGAVTGRMTHYEPNVAQVTAGTKIYGKAMRACWVAPEGYSIVGIDASGLELRMLAHYMNDVDYIREVLDGDVHTANQQAAGLASRDDAKTFIYAFLYGAGDAKIGSIVGGSKAAGKRLKAKFLSNTPALRVLRERVQRAARRGWLQGLDGRRIQVRSPHAALNTLLQGAGAVLMKQALVNLDTMAKAKGLDYKLVGNIHDEVQAEVLNAHTESFGKLGVYSIARAGTQLALRCPMTGEYKVGSNWSETH